MKLTPLYLRDLRERDREMIENIIRKYRKDLIYALDEDIDIVIGGYHPATDFKTEN